MEKSEINHLIYDLKRVIAKHQPIPDYLDADALNDILAEPKKPLFDLSGIIKECNTDQEWAREIDRQNEENFRKAEEMAYDARDFINDIFDEHDMHTISARYSGDSFHYKINLWIARNGGWTNHCELLNIWCIHTEQTSPNKLYKKKVYAPPTFHYTRRGGAEVVNYTNIVDALSDESTKNTLREAINKTIKPILT